MSGTTKYNQSQRLPQQPESIRRQADPATLESLLDEWMQGDAIEQRETFETLRQYLDADRPAGYKLFPLA